MPSCVANWPADEPGDLEALVSVLLWLWVSGAASGRRSSDSIWLSDQSMSHVPGTEGGIGHVRRDGAGEDVHYSLLDNGRRVQMQLTRNMDMWLHGN